MDEDLLTCRCNRTVLSAIKDKLHEHNENDRSWVKLRINYASIIKTIRSQRDRRAISIFFTLRVQFYPWLYAKPFCYKLIIHFLVPGHSFPVAHYNISKCCFGEKIFFRLFPITFQIDAFRTKNTLSFQRHCFTAFW